ncbi:MAG TPA: transcriptional regulator [Bacteroidia bacterium]|jgi:HTH-type transcriptional regulator/antitoxin HigA|nr:transcriptional regulator [Bacteroidia bacterium]
METKHKVIKTEKDYEKILERFYEVFHAKAGTKESDEADLLALLIGDYENRHFVMDAPNPIEAIKYKMAKEGLSNKDLAKILGYKSRVTDIFNKHRKLNLNMVRSLYKHLHIPLESLIKEY